MKKLIPLLFVFVFISCEKVIDLDLEFEDQRIVIEAKINKKVNSTDGFVEVLISETSSYFDNTGMNSDDCKKYKNFMNSNETIGRDKNSIGRHGMGSKFNDYQHSKKGSTVVFSKYEKVLE